MRGEKWEDVKHALMVLANKAGQFHADGIEVTFLNNPRRQRMIKVRDTLYCSLLLIDYLISCTGRERLA